MFGFLKYIFQIAILLRLSKLIHKHCMQTTTNKETIFYTISIKGDLDASSSIIMDNAMQEAVVANEKHILVDCERLEYISSAGLGVFMSYLTDFEENDTKMALYGLSAKVRNVFEMLGLDQLIKLCHTREEACSFVS